MKNKFEPGQRVVARHNDDCVMGKVVSYDDDYTVVQFEDLDHPTVLNEAALAD